jgi:hypothetical protein
MFFNLNNFVQRQSEARPNRTHWSNRVYNHHKARCQLLATRLSVLWFLRSVSVEQHQHPNNLNLRFIPVSMHRRLNTPTRYHICWGLTPDFRYALVSVINRIGLPIFHHKCSTKLNLESDLYRQMNLYVSPVLVAAFSTPPIHSNHKKLVWVLTDHTTTNLTVEVLILVSNVEVL